MCNWTKWTLSVSQFRAMQCTCELQQAWNVAASGGTCADSAQLEPMNAGRYIHTISHLLHNSGPALARRMQSRPREQQRSKRQVTMAALRMQMWLVCLPLGASLMQCIER
jgi:hypothetical protein